MAIRIKNGGKFLGSTGVNQDSGISRMIVKLYAAFFFEGQATVCLGGRPVGKKHHTI